MTFSSTSCTVNTLYFCVISSSWLRANDKVGVSVPTPGRDYHSLAFLQAGSTQLGKLFFK